MQYVPPSSPGRAEQGTRDSPAGMLLVPMEVQSQDLFFFLISIYLLIWLH